MPEPSISPMCRRVRSTSTSKLFCSVLMTRRATLAMPCSLALLVSLLFGCRSAPIREELPWAPLPALARPIFERAEGHREAGRLEPALTEYRRVLRVQPDHIPSHQHYQDLMIEQGRAAEVHEEYRLRLQERGEPLDWCLLGRLETNPTLQEFRFRRALEADPEFAWGHIALAGLLRKSGQIVLALEHQQYAVERMPDYLPGHLELADLYRESGRWAEAIEEYEYYRARIPEDFYTLECIAGCQLRQGDLEDAKAAFEEILALRPSHVEAHLGLASMALIERRRNVAASHLETARKLAPIDPDVHFNLGVLSEELDKDYEAAIDHYRRYVELGGAATFRANLRIQRLERRLQAGGSE